MRLLGAFGHAIPRDPDFTVSNQAGGTRSGFLQACSEQPHIQPTSGFSFRGFRVFKRCRTLMSQEISPF